MEARTENPPESFELMKSITEANQRLISQFLKKFTPDQRLEANEMVQSLTAGVLHDAEQLKQLNQRYAEKWGRLWTNIMQARHRAGGRTGRGAGERRPALPRGGVEGDPVLRLSSGNHTC